MFKILNTNPLNVNFNKHNTTLLDIRKGNNITKENILHKV